MAITRISQSTVKEGLEKFNSFYGGASGLLFGDFESIASVTVGSGGVSSIQFGSTENPIPQTYTHLQLRATVRTERTNSTSGDILKFIFNSDSSSIYSLHTISGDGGSTVSASGLTAYDKLLVYRAATNYEATGIFGGIILDILDYSSTSKTKTISNIGGFDRNGYAGVYIVSGLWASTSAITSINITTNAGFDIAEHTNIALYGVKA